ncbi:GNAT family N-acetyltransferase [Microbacterium sediminis]|uniref:Uncharacterized protein n=1 Tax=Microbacterium sediminis TaxID=904291 RepID=A0A1B9NIQ9_9MICO|nr:GNAT family N-acetyltransferase [Microbacterium sediminis]OCG76466.1 hypothetical protein A7J15_11825 [Microbacterium sediminis]QBR73042.1 N-acetyltransferase [Microbacterium sediminis]
MPLTPADVEFSVDQSRIDQLWVHETLQTHAYWVEGRTAEMQLRANQHSICYGLYRRRDGQQVAFARVLSDHAGLGWLCDVIVEPSERGGGLGKLLVEGIVADLDGRGIKRTILTTVDAHGLYARHGWAPLRKPEYMMERRTGPVPAHYEVAESPLADERDGT